jgi:hydroxymethylpyrimidine/phosphomethylpyrimidine kinase
MQAERTFVISIAGFDPTGGAGVLADIKTFEQHKVHGFAINTANTIQTESKFYEIQWTSLDFVLSSIEKLFANYTIKAIKIGIIPSLEYLKEIVLLVKKLSPETQIVWDTILKSTTEFDFLAIQNQSCLVEILKHIDLITPNYDEILKLNKSETNVDLIVEKLSMYCAVLLKGGHNPLAKGVDFLYTKNRFFRISPTKSLVSKKHGSGCVLSSAITANLALGNSLLSSCSNAKNYTENFLSSNPTLLGYHHV